MDRPIQVRGPHRAEQCRVEGCETRPYAVDLCHFHYHRDRVGKDLTAPRRSKGVRGEWNPWRTDSNGYIVRNRTTLDGQREFQAQHREVLAEKIGRPLERDENAHHKNKIRSDNRPENLELWNTAQPAGGRIEDIVEWAEQMLRRYKPEILK